MVTQHIKKALKKTNGRVHGNKGAAKLLGVNPSTLRNRMNKLKIDYHVVLIQIVKPQMKKHV